MIVGYILFAIGLAFIIPCAKNVQLGLELKIQEASDWAYTCLFIAFVLASIAEKLLERVRVGFAVSELLLKKKDEE